jgi:RNA polymerase sigma-70 factor, ECF subfamily
MTEDDDALLGRWRAGEPAAGEQLIERHLEAVHRFFANKVQHATDDLVQKTFLACLESVEGYEGRASFRSYLFAIARNVLFRHYRDEHHGFDPLTKSAATMIDERNSPADRVAEREEQRLLLRALRTLPLDLQVLLELAYWEGLSDAELAAVVEVPAGTIKSRLRKARHLLDEQLGSLAGSPALLESSRHTLDAWAAGIREVTGIEGSASRRKPR